MKESTREISVLKRRILEYLELKGVSKYECYKNTGITNGVLSQSNGLSEDNLMRFLSYYTDISYRWLFTGNGSVLKQNVSNDKNADNALVSSYKDTQNNRVNQEETSYIYKMYQDEKSDWKEEKKELKERIDLLQSELRQQSAELAALKAQYPQSQDKEPERHSGVDKATETFTDESLGSYGKGYSPTKPLSTSKKTLVGKT